DGRIVVLAHSQGAAIAANVIFTVLPASPGAPQVDTLLTVGAAVSLLGPSRLRRGAADLLTPVADWVASPTPVRWVNFWAVWDPFAAGPIADTHRARYERWASAYRAPAVPGAEPADDAASGPEERPVHNTAFPLTDHQGYAANTAQVIDPVARELAGLPPAPSVLRRRWVRIVKARGLARLLAIVIAVFVPFTALPSVVGGALYSTAVAVVETLGAFVDLSAVAGFLTSLRDGDHFTSVGATVVAIVVGLVVLGTLSWLGAWISHRQAVAVVSQIWSLPAWRIVDGAFRLVLVGAALLATDDVLSLDPLAWAVLAPIGIAVWAAPLNPAIPHDVPAQPAPPATQPVPPMPP
ncbi:MAG: hypothetical protein H7146_08635, partial [Burkholderiaceae bacterium]|nr:hypothetical protein [Microbacteriaceae bacterium]